MSIVHDESQLMDLFYHLSLFELLVIFFVQILEFFLNFEFDENFISFSKSLEKFHKNHHISDH